MAGIGFFAPLPLALMMPFMAGQSMVMGEAFGKSYQYGKRKISAMSNEEFNKLDMAQLGQQLATDYISIIPSLEKSVAASKEFQSFIIQEMAAIVRQLPSDIISGITNQSSVTQPDFTTHNPDSAYKSIENFFRSLTGGIPNVSATSIINSNTTGNQIFTETPITISDAEISQAQNQELFLSKYGNYTWSELNYLQQNATGETRQKIQQLMNSKKTPVTQSTYSAPQEISNFQVQHGKLLATALQAKEDAGAYGGSNPLKKRQLESRLQSTKKAYYNFLTNARNNPITKSLANNYLNKRLAR